jgi:hypothetical protein
VIAVRHFFGFILGIVVAPGLVLATGWGFMRTQQLRNDPGGSLTLAIAALAAAGLVIGVLMVAKWASPLATLLPGLSLLGWTIVYAVNPGQAALQLPVNKLVYQGMESLLVAGIYGLVGMALLIPTFTPSRWRSNRMEMRDHGDSYF